jgi:predicted TIM-barrel fold metal-dependent hydrolase
MVERAFDVHTHPPIDEWLVDAGGQYVACAEDYFSHEVERKSMAEMVEEYRAADVERAVLLGWDAETETGNPPLSNDWVAETRDEFDDFFVGFAGVDPRKGEAAVQEAERAVDELDFSGFKFHPSAQGFYPDDTDYDPLWEVIADAGVPALFHTGTTGFGAGVAGGCGIELEYANPMPYLDSVAARFPDMTIIMAHPAWPWESEQLAVLNHKDNVYMDLSGWSPKYIPEEVYTRTRTMLEDRVLFGTDYPFLSPEKWIEDFEEVEQLPDDVKQKILWDNAADLFGVE